jgi:hypothetical protein
MRGPGTIVILQRYLWLTAFTPFVLVCAIRPAPDGDHRSHPSMTEPCGLAVEAHLDARSAVLGLIEEELRFAAYDARLVQCSSYRLVGSSQSTIVTLRRTRSTRCSRCLGTSL